MVEVLVVLAIISVLTAVLPEDLLKFGLIPEFIGRLPVISSVHSLDKQALVRILVEPKNALVKQYRKFFEFEDVELEFTTDALGAVADQALLRGTGARGLRAILEEVLLNVMYDLPSREDVGKCVITREVVLEKVNPTLVPRAKEPAARPARGESESHQAVERLVPAPPRPGGTAGPSSCRVRPRCRRPSRPRRATRARGRGVERPLL